MSEPTCKQYRVLFVDDDPAFLDTMERIMTPLSQGTWEVIKAESASRAMARLQEGSVDLVVIDVQMPVVDGLQFLGLLHRRYPRLSKVVLTGYATEAYRVACLSHGAELFLEKPMTVQDQQGLYASLSEVMKFQPPEEEGFRGVLRRVGLPDVIQIECLNGNSSILEVESGGGLGRIYIHHGAIVHAEAGSRQGEEAFHHLLSLRGGEFRLEPFQSPAQDSIEAPWEFLVMESARKRDESGGGRVDSAVGAGRGGVVSPAPAVDPSCHARPAELAAGGEPVEVIEAKVETPAILPPRVIEEVLVCSGEGRVLREWKVDNSERWISFFEFLSQKARRIGRGLPVGELQRFEAAAGDERLMTVLGQDHGVLVRCREESR